ncbi:hypothetical protein ACF061_31045 [Streptomyces sp. NPDC015220]|uniref:hypothetical protein n=1 Tax=Streptomyces sp. NPDC015220 TaxID=3364947 RepID=UPI003701CEC7
MQDIHPAVRQIALLCASLEADGTLRAELADAGLSEGTWARMTEAVRRGEADRLAPMLEELEAVAERAGLDGVTVTSRAYQVLPDSDPPSRTISGWRCPHARPCGRAEVGADPGTERRCALTGDPLVWASVTSR